MSGLEELDAEKVGDSIEALATIASAAGADGTTASAWAGDWQRSGSRTAARPPAVHRRAVARSGSRRWRWRVAAQPGADPGAARARRPPAAGARRRDGRHRVRSRATTSTSRLLRLLREFRRPLLLGLVLVIIDGLATLAGPVLVKTGLDEGVSKGSSIVLFAAAGVFLLVTLHRPHRRDRRDVRHRARRAANHAVAPHPHLGAAATAFARLLRARDGRPDHDADDDRRRPVRVTDRERPALALWSRSSRSSESASRWW